MTTNTNYKILGGEIDVYTAPVGTPSPDPGDTIDTSVWEPLGSDYVSEEGVNFSYNETIEPMRTLQDGLPRKVFRTQEDHQVTLNMLDSSVEALARIVGSSVTSVAAAAGQIGTVSMDLPRTAIVDSRALLVTGKPPFPNDSVTGMIQYMPLVYVQQIGQFTRSKGATMIPVTFNVLRHSTLENKTIAISAEAAPGGFVSATATNFGYTSFTAGWTIPPSVADDIGSIEIQWTQPGESNFGPIVTLSATATSYDITGLDYALTGDLLDWAVRGLGKGVGTPGPWLADSNVQILASTTPSAVDTFTATGVAGGFTYTINPTATATGAPITAVYVTYRPTGGTWVTTREYFPPIPNAVESHSVAGLGSGTYNVRAIAYNDLGAGTATTHNIVVP